MKFLKTFLILSFFAGSFNLQAQVAEDTLTVEGVCKMCKERIETAAYVKGVKFAQWNQETDQLSIAYKSDKVSKEDIVKSILQAGHSVDGTAPEDENYSSLPNCCRYHEIDKH